MLTPWHAAASFRWSQEWYLAGGSGVHVQQCTEHCSDLWSIDPTHFYIHYGSGETMRLRSYLNLFLKCFSQNKLQICQISTFWDILELLDQQMVLFNLYQNIGVKWSLDFEIMLISVIFEILCPHPKTMPLEGIYIQLHNHTTAVKFWRS